MKTSSNVEFEASQKCANFVDPENAAHRVFTCKIGIDTAENEPPEVSMKRGVPKQAFHPSGTSRGRSASGPVEVALKQLVQLKLR